MSRSLARRPIEGQAIQQIVIKFGVKTWWRIAIQNLCIGALEAKVDARIYQPGRFTRSQCASW